jgi:hypothetical protein
VTPRIVWFVAGTAAGVYASVKARRAAYRLSVPGLADQVAALGVGLREMREEVRDGMEAKERDLTRDLYRRAALPTAPAAGRAELESRPDHASKNYPEKDTV